MRNHTSLIPRRTGFEAIQDKKEGIWAGTGEDEKDPYGHGLDEVLYGGWILFGGRNGYPAFRTSIARDTPIRATAARGHHYLYMEGTKWVVKDANEYGQTVCFAHSLDNLKEAPLTRLENP